MISTYYLTFVFITVLKGFALVEVHLKSHTCGLIGRSVEIFDSKMHHDADVRDSADTTEEISRREAEISSV